MHILILQEIAHTEVSRHHSAECFWIREMRRENPSILSESLKDILPLKHDGIQVRSKPFS